MSILHTKKDVCNKTHVTFGIFPLQKNSRSDRRIPSCGSPFATTGAIAAQLKVVESLEILSFASCCKATTMLMQMKRPGFFFFVKAKSGWNFTKENGGSLPGVTS